MYGRGNLRAKEQTTRTCRPSLLYELLQVTYSWRVWMIEQWEVHRLTCLYHERGACHEEVAVARLTVGRMVVKQKWHVPTSPCLVECLTLDMYRLLMT